MTHAVTNLASNNALARESKQVEKTLSRLGTESVTYDSVARAGYAIPTLVGGTAPKSETLESYLGTGEVITGVCWCSPYVTRALEAGVDPGNPTESLESPSQLRRFAQTYLPEARQIIDQIGGVITGLGDPDRIILIHESELFTRKISALTEFPEDTVREIVYDSYERISRVTERYILHKNPAITVRHVTMDAEGYESLVSLMRRDENRLYEAIQANAERVQAAIDTTDDADPLNLRMHPRGPYGNAEANAPVALLTETVREFLHSQNVSLAPKSAIINNHHYLSDQNYGRRWWRDRGSLYLYELQTTPPGQGRNATVVHLGVLSMLNPFGRRFDQRQTYLRGTPRFESNDRAGTVDEWLSAGLAVPTTETLNPTNPAKWLQSVRDASTPEPTVRYLTSSPEAFVAVNFSPEQIPPELPALVSQLKSGEFSTRAKQQVALTRGFQSFSDIPDTQLGAALGTEVRTRTNELRRDVWDDSPAEFYEPALREAEQTIMAMYDC